MYKKLLLAAIFFVSASFAFSQTMKVGVVDFQQVVMQMPEAQSADQMLKEISGKYQDSIAKMQKDLTDKFTQYQKQKSMMSQEAQQKTEEGLQSQNELIYKFKQEKEQEVYKLRIELLEPIKNKVLKAVQEVAKAEKMSFILDKTNPALIYSEEKFDVTFTVIDKIKRGVESK